MAGRRWLPVVLAALAIGGTGCSQTTPQTMTDAALSGPLVLNSAPGAAPVATAVPPPAATTPQPTALQAEPAPVPATAALGASEDEGQFPNINKPPTQPGGTLLPEAARTQIIAELEALRTRQDTAGSGSGNGAGKPSDLAEQASTHGQAAIEQIEACSQEGALENNPDCAPAD